MRCGVWGVVLIPSSGAVVWVIPYEPLKIKQQQLHLQQQQQQQQLQQQQQVAQPRAVQQMAQWVKPRIGLK